MIDNIDLDKSEFRIDSLVSEIIKKRIQNESDFIENFIKSHYGIDCSNENALKYIIKTQEINKVMINGKFIGISIKNQKLHTIDGQIIDKVNGRFEVEKLDLNNEERI